MEGVNCKEIIVRGDQISLIVVLRWVGIRCQFDEIVYFSPRILINE
jgi:hypothetical protein